MTEWRDIESAPKDGTWVLTWSKCEGHGLGRYCAWMLDEGGKPFDQATHWMPLPAPPGGRMTKANPDALLELAEWCYAVLSEFPSDGQLRSDAQREIAPQLIGAGYIERVEITKACKCCGTPKFDYSYFKITTGGRLFMAAMARSRAQQVKHG